MSLEEKGTQCKKAYDQEYCSQVFQCVAYITHKCPILQELFLKWIALTPREKILLDYIAFYVIDKAQMELFAPILQGFSYWNAIQDTEGACGFHENPLEFRFDLEEEKQIFQIILIIDQITSSILIRPYLCVEIKNFRGEKNLKNKIIRCTGRGDDN